MAYWAFCCYMHKHFTTFPEGERQVPPRAHACGRPWTSMNWAWRSCLVAASDLTLEFLGRGLICRGYLIATAKVDANQRMTSDSSVKITPKSLKWSSIKMFDRCWIMNLLSTQNVNNCFDPTARELINLQRVWLAYAVPAANTKLYCGWTVSPVSYVTVGQPQICYSHHHAIHHDL